MLKVEEKDAIPPDQVRVFCESLKTRFEQANHVND